MFCLIAFCYLCFVVLCSCWEKGYKIFLSKILISLLYMCLRDGNNWENNWNMFSVAFSITQLNIRKMASLWKSKASHLQHLDKGKGVGMQWFKSMSIISAGQTLKISFKYNCTREIGLVSKSIKQSHRHFLFPRVNMSTQVRA